MCGEHVLLILLSPLVLGSSPHVRGAHGRRGRRRVRPGIIPACAGSTGEWTQQAYVVGDHPRMCGEHEQTINTTAQATGSSPHVRGALGSERLPACGIGIIPACAGSTQMDGMGDDDWLGSSPHVRGARLRNAPA